MSLLNVSNVSVSYGANDILDSITAEANLGERIGLVGRNGAGKTTLLRVLAGIERPTVGQRHAARWLRSVMVEQIPPLLDANTTVREEVLSSVQDVIELERALHEAADAMADGDDEAAESYAALLERMEFEGAYSYEARFAQIMNGLGFGEGDWSRPLGVLSGGQRARVGLAKALMAAPDLLLMDEPTNHLDIHGLRWLESFLGSWRGAVIVTSHDRYFLDKIATRVWHVENRRLRTYPGNYSKFVELRAAEVERQQKEFEAQQQFIQKEEAFIRRYGAGQRAAEAKGREKRLNRLHRLEAPSRQRAVRFRFNASRGSDLVLATRGLMAGYGATPVLRLPDIELDRGERVALIGRNGSGKTTLLRTVARELAPVQGSYRIGPSVQVAHYWQEAEGLDPSLTVLEELMRDTGIDFQAARDLLGRFLFSGEEVAKSVGVLSGGERSRLALAKLVLSGANLLLLDEPTNHLDIPAREALEEALDAFQGTIVFASHDRRLIAALATRLWIVDDGSLEEFDGTLEEYTSREEEPPPVTPARSQPAPPARAPRSVSAARRQAALQDLENTISERERELSELGDAINRAGEDGDMYRLADLGRRFESLQEEVESLMEDWTAAHEEEAQT